MNKEKRSGWIRMLIGGALGLLGGFVWVPYVLYSREYPPLALLACVGLGVMAGVATQPFAESGSCCCARLATLPSPPPFSPCW